MRGGQSLLHGVAESHVHPHTSADRGDSRPITGAGAQSPGREGEPRRALGAGPLLWPEAQVFTSMCTIHSFSHCPLWKLGSTKGRSIVHRLSTLPTNPDDAGGRGSGWTKRLVRSFPGEGPARSRRHTHRHGVTVKIGRQEVSCRHDTRGKR